ncbi:MAG: hypothetical protein AAFO95_05400, partial [Cyanobacteria bacterium J06600_6]
FEIYHDGGSILMDKVFNQKKGYYFAIPIYYLAETGKSIVAFAGCDLMVDENHITDFEPVTVEGTITDYTCVSVTLLSLDFGHANLTQDREQLNQYHLNLIEKTKDDRHNILVACPIRVTNDSLMELRQLGFVNQNDYFSFGDLSDGQTVKPYKIGVSQRSRVKRLIADKQIKISNTIAHKLDGFVTDDDLLNLLSLASTVIGNNLQALEYVNH